MISQHYYSRNKDNKPLYQFVLGVIPPKAPFYDRLKELQELSSYAENRANVVLFFPRR